jgi:hypothetical protein
MTARLTRLWIGLLAASLLAGGCSKSPGEVALADQLAQSRRQVIELTQRKEALEYRLNQQDQQISTLVGLDGGRMDHLFTVEKINISRYSSAVTADGSGPGRDAIRVYVECLDRDGSGLKAAGAIVIRLFDLSAKPEEVLLGECSWPVDQVGRCWRDGLLAYHYDLLCPLPKGVALPDVVTIRVQFTDYLTGKVLSAQQFINLPPATPTTSSAPAATSASAPTSASGK